MKTWHIWDFPDNIYVSLKKDFHEKFFEEMFKKHGGKRPYSRFLGLSQMTIKQYWRRYSKKNGKKYIQYIPLWVIKKSCKTKRLKGIIEKGIENIRVRGGNPIINPKLSIKESPSLYRTIAHLIGDGYAGKEKVPYYSNTNKKLRQQFKKDLQIFGKIKTYERTPNTTPCIMFPKPISDILRYIFDIDFIRPSKLPKEIFEAPKECKRVFLQALFDDDGTISTVLSIGIHNENILKQIKQLLDEFNIITGKITKLPYQTKKVIKYRMSFNVFKKSYKNFQKEINFSHPSKVKNLEFAIKTQNRKLRTRSLEFFEKEILNLLNKKPSRTLKIANTISLTPGYTLTHLKYLEKQNKIKRINNGNYFTWKSKVSSK